MTGPRDFQRSKVYSAEWYMPGGAEHCGGRLETVELMQEFCDLVVKSRWAEARRKQKGGPTHVTVTDGRGRKRAGACHALAEIAMPRWSRCKLQLLHEVTHLFVPTTEPTHGREFCATYLEFVRRWMDRDSAVKLKDAFGTFGVKHTRSPSKE